VKADRKSSANILGLDQEVVLARGMNRMGFRSQADDDQALVEGEVQGEPGVRGRQAFDGRGLG
jgi:hypothetical protein